MSKAILVSALVWAAGCAQVEGADTEWAGGSAVRPFSSPYCDNLESFERGVVEAVTRWSQAGNQKPGDDELAAFYDAMGLDGRPYEPGRITVETGSIWTVRIHGEGDSGIKVIVTPGASPFVVTQVVDHGVPRTCADLASLSQQCTASQANIVQQVGELCDGLQLTRTTLACPTNCGSSDIACNVQATECLRHATDLSIAEAKCRTVHLRLMRGD